MFSNDTFRLALIQLKKLLNYRNKMKKKLKMRREENLPIQRVCLYLRKRQRNIER